MKIAKKALALFLCTIMLMSCLYVGGDLGFMADGIKAYAADKNSATAFNELQNENSPRLELSFNKNWKFHQGNPAHAGDGYGACDESSWDNVNLPHDFMIEKGFKAEGTERESGNIEGGDGWYRKSFVMPANFRNRRIVLNFDGSYSETMVYVNGKRVGENLYGYNSFSIDVTDALVKDGVTKNVVAVHVLSPNKSSRWYPGGGLSRDVTMTITNPVHVALYGTHVQTPNLESSKGADATVSTAVTIENNSPAAQSYYVKTSLHDAKGVEIANAATRVLQVEPNASKTSDIVMKPSKKVELWDTKNPNLYTVRTQVFQGKDLVDVYDTEIGFRWIKWDAKTGFSLNGVPTKIEGVCMHHDQGALGAVQNRDAIARQIDILKDMGINAIRTSHNVPSKVFLELCNEKGILVMEEFFDGLDYMKNENSNDFGKYFNTNMTPDGAKLIGGGTNIKWSDFVVRQAMLRDRNNPSIVIWSMANEISFSLHSLDHTWDTFSNIASHIRSLVKSLDSTRPLTQGNNQNGGTNDTRKVDKHMDVVGANYRPELWVNTRNTYFPEKPFIATESTSSVNSRGVYNAVKTKEFGTNENYYKVPGANHLSSYDNTKVNWGAYAAEAWAYAAKNAWFSGEFVWTGFDYIGEPTPWNGDATSTATPNTSYFGITDTAGFAKDSYYLYRSMWNEEGKTLHLVPGTWTADELTLDNGYVNVAVYSNADHIELLLDDVVIATAKSTNHVVNGYTYKTWAETVVKSDACNANAFNTAEGGDFYAQFKVKHSGTKLSVKAYDAQNHDITKESVGTKEAIADAQAVKIVAKTWNDVKTLTADGKSLAYVELTAVDANNKPVINYNGEVQVKVSGAATVEGVDNGDQTSLDKFQSPSIYDHNASDGARIKLFNGKAVIILQSTDEEGAISLNIGSTENMPVEGNTTKMFRNVEGVVTLNSVEEKGKARVDEFEEIIPQLVNDKDFTTTDSIGQADVIRVLGRDGMENRIRVRFHREMYMDINENLNQTGYKFYIDGSDDRSHYGGANDTDYRIVYHASLWGAHTDEGLTKDRTFADNFTGYKATKLVGSTDGENYINDYKVVDRNGDNGSSRYQNWELQLNGVPKKTGDFAYDPYGTYTRDHSKDSRLWSIEHYEYDWGAVKTHFVWKGGMWISGKNYIKDQNGALADYKMTIHVYDKTNLKNWVNVDMVKPLNANYKNLLVDNGAWNRFVSIYEQADVDNAMKVIKTRKTSQQEIDAAANALKPAVDAANALEFKAPQSDIDALNQRIADADAILNVESYHKKFTSDSRNEFERVLNLVKNNPLVKDGVKSHKVDMNNFDSLNAGYKANADMISLQQLLKDLDTAIKGLQEDAQKYVKATIFKYGYDNTKQGVDKYRPGGAAMNNIAYKQAYADITTHNKDAIGSWLDYVVTNKSEQNSSWGTGRREQAIKDLTARYATYYSLAFTGVPVTGMNNVIPSDSVGYRNTAWNVWCKTGTQGPNETHEEGASVQGLAAPTLTTGPKGEKYFQSHPNYYSKLPFENITSDKDYRTDKSFKVVYGGGIYHTKKDLDPLDNVTVYSPDLFKKENLKTDGTPTTSTSGNFAKFYWDTDLPLKTTTRDGINYFEYDSSSNDYILQTKFNDAKQTAVMEYEETPNGWNVNRQSKGAGKGFFPFNYQAGTTNFTGENAIYHYGMTFETEFALPEGGKYKNEDDVVFEFTGDDDVYVYIDDVLVLDNGGLHGARKSSINFTDESVTYQYALDVKEGTIKKGPHNSATPNSKDIYYKYGANNQNISADNEAALHKLHEVKTDKNSHTLTFFFLERGSTDSNCGIKFNMKAASENVKLNRQSYVVDYDANLKMNVKDNDVITKHAQDTPGFEQTYLGIAHMNEYGQLNHESLEFSDQHTPDLLYAFDRDGTGIGNNTLKFSTDFGNYEFKRNGELKFKPTTMKYNSQDYFYIVSAIKGDPSFSANATYYYYEPVTIAPATSVYYEDNAGSIDYHNGNFKTPGMGAWKTVGDKAMQDNLALNLVTNKRTEGHYGYNDGYSNFKSYSAGAAHEVAVDNSVLNRDNPTATFTFTGTGFDVIAATTNKTGLVRVEVTNAAGEKVAQRTVDTYYNQQFGQLYQTADGTITLTAEGNTPVYFSEHNAYTTNPTHYETVDGVEKIVNGKAAEGQKEALAFGWLNNSAVTPSNVEVYQAPIVKVTNLPYGEYTAKVTIAYSPRYSHGNSDYKLILDAVRIYDPIDPQNKMTNGLHEYQYEANPVRLELRDKLIGSEMVTSTQNGVLMYNGAALESKALESFTSGCPTHEVYLTNDTAVAFHLWAKAEPLHAKLGAKLANKKGIGTLGVTIGNNATKNISLETSTDMFYKLDGIKWTKDNDGWYKSELITLKNVTGASSTISLTNVELTFAADSEAQLKKADVPEAKLMVTAATPRMFTAVMNRNEADLALNVVNTAVALNDNGKSDVTVTLTSSKDVDKIVVKNDYNSVVNAVIENKVEGNSKTWTVKFTEETAGRHTYTVEAMDGSGYTGTADPLKVTFTAKKAPFGYQARKAIKNFFDKLFGRK